MPEILEHIVFVIWISGFNHREQRHEFKAPNPPMYHGNPDLFQRLSFDYIKTCFEDLGYAIDHIIRGESTENSVRDCYVYRGRDHVPFAIIRPLVFERS